MPANAVSLFAVTRGTQSEGFDRNGTIIGWNWAFGGSWSLSLDDAFGAPAPTWYLQTDGTDVATESDGITRTESEVFDRDLSIGLSFGSGEARGFFDGVKTRTWTGLGSTIPYADSGGVDGVNIAGGNFTGFVYVALAWARALADAEMRALHENPWQLFRPRTLRIYSLPASGIPVLSGSTVIDIGQTSARPRVTITF
jgi:hypothetical protein